MTLRVLIGCANSGKTDAVVREIRSTIADRRSALLLLPSQPEVARATLSYASVAAVGLRIATLDEFMDEIWQGFGDGREIVSPVQRITLVEESGKNWQPTSFMPSSAHGTLALLGRVVERAAESPRGPDQHSLPEGTARDIAALVERYQALLDASGLVERSEAHREITDTISRLRLPDLIAADGFTGFTRAQEKFLVRAADTTAVLATLPYCAGAPATEGASGVLARLAAVGSVKIIEDDGAGSPPAELVRLARHLGSVGTDAVSPGGALVLSEAWGGRAEAARIARDVQDALEAGIEPSSIAVVFREVAPHLRDLRAELRDAGVEAEYDARIRFGATELGRVLLALLRIEALPHAALMDALRSPYGPSPDHVLDEFDEHVRRRSSTARAARAWFARTHPPTARFLRDVQRLHDAPARDVERAWFGLVSQMLRMGRSASDGSDELTVDAAAARVFFDALSSLRAAGAGRIEPDRFADVLRHAHVALSSTDDPERVQVMEAERARGRRFRCVILGGLTAGEFPRTPAEDALSDAEVVEAFSESGIDLSPRGSLGDERLLFYQVVTRATERLVLSRRTHDEQGRPLRPSIFVEEVLDLYRDPVTREGFAGLPPVRALGPGCAAEHPDGPRSGRRTLRAELERRGHADSAIGHTGVLRRVRPRPGRLSEAARRLVADREVFSASEIETYLQCPFRWCVQQLVKPKEIDGRFDHAATGRLAHEILYRFYEALAVRAGVTRVDSETLDRALPIHDEVADLCIKAFSGLTAAEAMACRAVARKTRSLVEADATLLPGFAPVRHEWSFGIGGDDHAEAFDGFSLAGRVDRVDSDGQRLVLTDYKSGDVGAEHGFVRFECAGVVQLPLYAAVASRRFGLPVAAGVYRSLKGGKPRGFVGTDLASSAFVRTDVVADADAMAALVADSISRAGNAVERLRSGDISAHPRGATCPPYCAARAFCDGWRPGRG